VPIGKSTGTTTGETTGTSNTTGTPPDAADGATTKEGAVGPDAEGGVVLLGEFVAREEGEQQEEEEMLKWGREDLI
jgi:hypothetical protein